MCFWPALIYFVLKMFLIFLCFLLRTADLLWLNEMRLMWIKKKSKTNAETYSDFFITITQRICYVSCIFPWIYTYTAKQIKVIFYLNPSQQNMIFPFNASELIVSTRWLYFHMIFTCASVTACYNNFMF